MQESLLNSNGSWQISSKKGLYINYPDNEEVYTSPLNIVLKNKEIYINNKKVICKELKIEPVQGFLKFKENEYQGTFIITKYNNNFLLINNVELEDYIFSVLKTECWPGWPLEVYKIMAITSRSYGIANLLETKKTSQPFHIRNTNKHQTYTGVHYNKLMKQAVEETRGLVLAYKKKPILAMYDACCGGVIPANIAGVNFVKCPYLARKKQCIYCRKCKFFNWSLQYDKKTLTTILKREYPKLTGIKEIRVFKKDKAGLVKIIEVTDGKSRYHITGKRFYSLINKVVSYYYSITTKGNKIIFKGQGLGHHLGLCEWGARQMVEDGLDYRYILKFYYPGTKFMKLHMK